MNNFKNINDLYKDGYQSILICRDCWQTNYMHEKDFKTYELKCMCGDTYKVYMREIPYDFTPSKFLWFKTETQKGTMFQICSELISTAEKCTCPEDGNTIYTLPACPLHPFPKNSPLKPGFFEPGSSYVFSGKGKIQPNA